MLYNNRTYRLLALTKSYNAHMGTFVDHVRFREMWRAMGPVERADLMAILGSG